MTDFASILFTSREGIPNGATLNESIKTLIDQGVEKISSTCLSQLRDSIRTIFLREFPDQIVSEQVSSLILIMSFNEQLRDLLYRKYCKLHSIKINSGKLPQDLSHQIVDLWGRNLANQALLNEILELREHAILDKNEELKYQLSILQQAVVHNYLELLRHFVLSVRDVSLIGLSRDLLP